MALDTEKRTKLFKDRRVTKSKNEKKKQLYFYLKTTTVPYIHLLTKCILRLSQIII